MASRLSINGAIYQAPREIDPSAPALCSPIPGGVKVNWGGTDEDSLDGDLLSVVETQYAGRFYWNASIKHTDQYNYTSTRNYSIQWFYGSPSSSPVNHLRYPYVGYRLEYYPSAPYQQIYIDAYSSTDGSGSVASLAPRTGSVLWSNLYRNVVVNSVSIQQVQAPTIGYKVTASSGQISERIGKGYPSISPFFSGNNLWVNLLNPSESLLISTYPECPVVQLLEDEICQNACNLADSIISLLSN